MKVILSMTKLMDTGFVFQKQNQHTRELGNKITSMAKVKKLGLTAQIMMDSISKVRRQALGDLFLSTNLSIMASSKTETFMVLALTNGLIITAKLVFGNLIKNMD